MRGAFLVAAAGLLVAAAPASAAWTPGVSDLQTVATMEVDHDVAVDRSGNALAVWDAPTGARTAIRVRRYDAAAGVWDAGRELSVANSDNRTPYVNIDAAGNAFAVWQRREGDHYVIQARRFDAEANAWESTAATLSTAGEASFTPALAFEPDGDAVAVWRGDSVIRARRYDAKAHAWESAAPALSSDTGGAIQPDVVVDASGVATVAWEIAGAVEAKRYDPLAERWPAAATQLSGSGAGDVRLGVDGAGRVHAVWSATEAGATFVETRRFDGSWGPVTGLSPRAGIAYAPELAVSASGEATVAWFAQQDGKYVIRARRWDGTRWDAGAVLSSPAVNAWTPKVGADESGAAIVVWRRPGSPSTIETRRFDPVGGWEPGPIALSGPTGAEAPAVGVGSRGDAIALWQRPSGGSVTVQARRFVAPPEAPKPIPPAPSVPDAPELAASPVASVPDTPELAASPVASVPDAPEVTGLRMRGLRVELRLTAPAQLRAALERRAGERWKRVETRTLSVKAGTVRFSFDRSRTRLSGRYRVTVSLGELTERTSFRVR